MSKDLKKLLSLIADQAAVDVWFIAKSGTPRKFKKVVLQAMNAALMAQKLLNDKDIQDALDRSDHETEE